MLLESAGHQNKQEKVEKISKELKRRHFAARITDRGANDLQTVMVEFSTLLQGLPALRTLHQKAKQTEVEHLNNNNNKSKKPCDLGE